MDSTLSPVEPFCSGIEISHYPILSLTAEHIKVQSRYGRSEEKLFIRTWILAIQVLDWLPRWLTRYAEVSWLPQPSLLQPSHAIVHLLEFNVYR